MQLDSMSACKQKSCSLENHVNGGSNSYSDQAAGGMFVSSEHEVAQTLRVLPLRMRCRSKNLALGGISGPLWRSGFGVSLARHFPGIFSLLFADQAKLGRLYALLPPDGDVTPGSDFELGINLFGEATEYAVVCAQAVSGLGAMGIGTPRGYFEVMSARVSGQSEFMTREEGMMRWPAPLKIRNWQSEAIAGNRLQVCFTTPLRIKDGNSVLTKPPEFEQLVRRLQGRLAQLCKAAAEANPLPLDLAQRLLVESVNIHRIGQKVRWVEVKRRSARTEQTMHFGGLVGEQLFSGPVEPYSGLLALGEFMQMGGKTTFGFGCMQTKFFNEE